MVSPKSSFILYDLEHYRQDGQENICEIGIFLRNLSNLGLQPELSAYGGCLNIFSGTLSNNDDEEKEIIKQWHVIIKQQFCPCITLFLKMFLCRP